MPTRTFSLQRRCYINASSWHLAPSQTMRQCDVTTARESQARRCDDAMRDGALEPRTWHVHRQCGASTACEEVQARRAIRCCEVMRRDTATETAITARQKNPHSFSTGLVRPSPFNASSVNDPGGLPVGVTQHKEEKKQKHT